MASSAATCQRTSTGASGMPPFGSNGCGASRVQSTTPSGNGSPEAIPSENGVPPNTGVATGAEGVWANSGRAASAPATPLPPSTNVRRLCGWTFAMVRIR
jgi:hypothetical protein